MDNQEIKRLNFKVTRLEDCDFNTICRFKLQEGTKKYYYERDKDGGIKIGINLLKQGYNLTEYVGNVYAEYNIECMKATIGELLKENKSYQTEICTLNEKLLEEQFRPPELGGSEYESAEQHFNSLQ